MVILRTPNSNRSFRVPQSWFSFFIVLPLTLEVACSTGGSANGGGPTIGGSSTTCFIVLQCHEPTPLPETESRFKVEMDAPVLIEHDAAAGKVKAQINFRLVPTITDNSKSVRIFLGRASLHDANLFDAREASVNHNKLCSQVTSCITSGRWLRENNPILVRGSDQRGILVPWKVEYKDTVKALRLAWEFYQVEHNDGSLCKTDTTRPYPEDGIPFVHAVRMDGTVTTDWCYNDLEAIELRPPHIAQSVKSTTP